MLITLSKMHHTLVFALAVSGQIVVSNYPQVDMTAPGNVSWTHFFLANQDIPNLEVRSTGIGATDWSRDYTACVAQDDWALTYDDGPGLPTPGVLQALREYNLTATFFVTGSRVLQFPQVLRQIYNDGHQIGIHTWAHRHLTTLTNDQIVAEVMYTARAISDVIGVMPNYVRPPFGDQDERVRAVLRALGLSIVFWNRDTNDAASMTVNATFAEWFQQPRTGSISLQHDLFASSAAQIPATLNLTRGSGYRFRTVVDCLGRQDAYRRFPNIPLFIPPTSTVQNIQSTTTQRQNSPTRTLNSDSGLQIAAGVLASVFGIFFL
jgi:peptidoglycan/xylan/chitin deacetylase (PgdA/CDA1 family)